MSSPSDKDEAAQTLELAAKLAIGARTKDCPLDPAIAYDKEPSGFNIALQRQPSDPMEVIAELDRAAQGRLGDRRFASSRRCRRLAGSRMGTECLSARCLTRGERCRGC